MKTVEMHLPSVLGAEKEAMETAALIARGVGFSADRIEDLKTALSEACINAIEHGNKFGEQETITVFLAAGDSSLHMRVRDKGKGFRIGDSKGPIRDHSIPRRRGWGMFIIRKLVNEVCYEITPEGGCETKMVIHLDKDFAEK
ncbi:MAG: ATP-binding protein [Desulfobulbaceae bacterium]|nr:ATP-binding protein [Desulfobulbaceae bacterium]